jgi:hypothetical protein
MTVTASRFLLVLIGHNEKDVLRHVSYSTLFLLIAGPTPPQGSRGVCPAFYRRFG